MSDDGVVQEQAARGAGQGRILVVLGLIAALAVGFLIGFLIPRGDSQGVPAADSVDVGFSQDMSVHHNQAIEMATIALTGSTDQRVQNLAYDILTTQQNQVGQMQGWLSLWDRAPLPTGEYMMWMSDDAGHMHGEHAAGHGSAGGSAPMPGMATSQELAALRAASGPELDVLFLQLMLRHHEGGLPMMEYGAEHGETPAVRTLAQTMVDTQTGESQLITSMLAERGAQPLPMN
ncbi:DUF305 domain-containing protein [Rhodococcus zopfii]|uniref:DUF305 domain-containing protein n=1 Tax=Rhodococcus zopfii TaxID=43772 RepID=UPI0011115275|nr:DUF305 domain-containing protein [Rhodococcus zopfii]